jgi:hypothetical protein
MSFTLIKTMTLKKLNDLYIIWNEKILYYNFYMLIVENVFACLPIPWVDFVCRRVRDQRAAKTQNMSFLTQIRRFFLS